MTYPYYHTDSMVTELVEMEELAGDITAISSVTQESGQRIGTALRTIYSRITTMDGSREILEGLGIAMYEMGAAGPEIRDVSDILGDLAGQWKNLSSEQQQNIAVTMAGRSRLTQFLALMNNYETSIDATTAAYASQGSAMREQEAYMQSYEYQLEVMGASATELALVMEEKLVGDAMYLVITSATDLIEVLTSIVDTFGLLPPVIFAATTAITAFKSTLNVKTFGITLALSALAAVVEKLIGKFADARRSTEETERALETSMELYNSHGNDISGLIDRYEELDEVRRNSELDVEQQQEYNILVNELSTMMPGVVDSISAQGEVHLKNADAIREEAFALDELAEIREHAELATMSEDFSDLQAELEKAIEDNKRYEQTFVETRETMKLAQQDFDAYSLDSYGFTTDNIETEQKMMQELAEEYSKSANAYSTSEYERMEVMQRSMLLVGDYTVGMMGLSGELENVSVTGQATISRWAQANEELFASMEFEEIQAMSLEVGRIIAEQYDNIAESMDGIDTDKAVEALDTLMASLSDDTLSQTMDLLKTDIDAIGQIISDVASGAELDIDSTIAKLVDYGMEFDAASELVKKLGIEFENSSIRSAIAEEELTTYNEELAYTKELALETIDPLEQLFGISGEDVQSMRSHIDLLGLLQTQYGETWAEADQGQESLQVLAEYFGQSTDFVVEHIDVLDEVLTAINGATIELDESGNRFVQFEEGVSESIRNIALEFMFGEDSLSNFSGNFIQEVGLVTKSSEELEEMAGRLEERFKAFDEAGRNLNSSEWNLVLQELNEQLGEIRGSFVAVQDETGKWQLQMADGSESPYLDNLNEQLDEYGITLHAQRDGTGEFYELLVQGPSGEELVTISDLNQMADTGIFAIEEMEEALRGLHSEATSESERETFVKTINDQLDLFGEGITTAKTEAGDLKLVFEDESESPWLNRINSLIEELGLEIEVTKEKTGDFKISLLTSEGETIFSQAAAEAAMAEEEISETGTKADAVTEKERKPIDIKAETTQANQEITTIDEKVDTILGKNRSPIDVDADASGADAEVLRADQVVSQFTGQDAEKGLDMDSTNFHTEAQNVKNTTDELEKEKTVNLKLNYSQDQFNDIVDKVFGLKDEITTLDGLIAGMQETLGAVVTQTESLLESTRSINIADSSIRKLSNNIDSAIEKMETLRGLFSSNSIDVSGLDSAAQSISNNVTSISTSVQRAQIAILNLNDTMSLLGAAFNISPMVAYSQSMAVVANSITNSTNIMSDAVLQNVIDINSALALGNITLTASKDKTSDDLGLITILYRLTKEMVLEYIDTLSVEGHAKYKSMVTKLLGATNDLRTSLESKFSDMSDALVTEITNMGNLMSSTFEEKMDDIVSAASSLPEKIGGGITQNMSDATDSMASLAQNMVKRFKTELGIHSPSRVFESLGGDVIDGLVNGLTGGELTNLGQNVFSEFSDGAISTIDQIKGYMTFDPVSAASFGGSFSMTSGFGPRSSPGGIGSTNHQGVDFAAPMGTPIRSQSSGRVVSSGYMGGLGNAVIVESAGGVRHVYGHNSRNTVGVGQTIGRGQIIGLVGSTGNSTGPHVHYEVRLNGVAIDPTKYIRGFANGGFVDEKELAWHGEEGLEAIIPLVPQRRERGLDLWEQTGELLGLNSDILRMLTRTQRKSGGFTSGGGFTGLDGDAGEGGSETATSGVIQPDYTSLMRSMETPDQPMFAPMEENEPDPLYRRDMYDVRVGWYSNLVTRANTELTALVEKTLQYRNALEEVNYQERKLREATQQQLNQTVKRQGQIEKQLGTLRNTSKHTEEQRKQWNDLQQEYDKNVDTIMSLENEIRKLTVSMRGRQVEIYKDYIEQLTLGFDNLSYSINRTVEELDFALDYVTLTDENNIGAQLEIQYDLLRESMRMEQTLLNRMNRFQHEYERAVDRYGRVSEQAITARDEYHSSEDDYRSSVIERINLEQEIESTREEVAEQGIETLKSYYDQTQSMTERAIEIEKEALEKHHEDKMDMYDEEIAKIESVYDTRLAEMDAQEAEDEYNQTISDLNAQRAELMQQISRASRDTSLEGRKRLAELQEELTSVNEEMAEVQSDRQDELYKEAIERQRDEQIQALEMERERAEEEQEIRLESLDQQLADAQRYSERMVNDEAMWERLRDEFVAGNTHGLASMVNEMTEQMSRYMSGDFGMVSMGYDDLSDEDRARFSEETLIEISGLMLESSESMERFVSAANQSVEDVRGIRGGTYNVNHLTTWSEPQTSTRAEQTPTLPPPPKPAPKPKRDNRYYTIKKYDTLWDLAQKYYGNPYKWTTIAQANQNPDPRRLQIGRKLLIPFDTGGFTGDWMGDEGRVALLHKKELVLNENQTEDILNVAKIVDRITEFIPRMNVSRPRVSHGDSGGVGDTYNLDNLVLEIPDFNGDEEDVRKVFNEMHKSLKKLGR